MNAQVTIKFMNIFDCRRTQAFIYEIMITAGDWFMFQIMYMYESLTIHVHVQYAITKNVTSILKNFKGFRDFQIFHLKLMV